MYKWILIRTGVNITALSSFSRFYVKQNFIKSVHCLFSSLSVALANRWDFYSILPPPPPSLNPPDRYFCIISQDRISYELRLGLLFLAFPFLRVRIAFIIFSIAFQRLTCVSRQFRPFLVSGKSRAVKTNKFHLLRNYLAYRVIWEDVTAGRVIPSVPA